MDWAEKARTRNFEFWGLNWQKGSACIRSHKGPFGGPNADPGVGYVDFVGAASTHFDIDRVDVLLAAAEALDKGEIGTVFDAVHACQAMVAGTELHTTDAKLLASPFPTVPF